MITLKQEKNEEERTLYRLDIKGNKIYLSYTELEEIFYQILNNTFILDQVPYIDFLKDNISNLEEEIVMLNSKIEELEDKLEEV